MIITKILTGVLLFWLAILVFFMLPYSIFTWSQEKNLKPIDYIFIGILGMSELTLFFCGIFLFIIVFL
jgi:hypothetical protein